MIVRRALGVLVAIAIIAAAAGVAVVAAAFALYALLRDPLGPAGAAAVVTGAAALVGLLAGLIAFRKSHPRESRDNEGLTNRVIDLARQRPVIVTAAAIGVAVIVARNPKLVTAALTAFLAGKAAPKS